eukprot:TRINITY_DN2673_c0_g1_i1.p1 TRINITY_DN2673_c0_g1~~TRINITY_DN2673_c0_g1_i1.p1  ORF type:complete len:155 (-),score=67.47 TRINITY_DN2673_c0_g1_i1:139-603(-)
MHHHKKMLELCTTSNIDILRNWDSDIEAIKSYEEIAPNIYVMHSTYLAPYPVWKREFVAMRCKKQNEDGTCISWGCSINGKKYPEPTEYVRSVLSVSGWILKAIPGEPNKCECTRVARIDPKGYVPAFVVNMFKTKLGSTFVAIRNYLQRTQNA